MPLSELYCMAKGKFEHNQQKNNTSSSDPPFIPVNDFAELVWENGQILMQGQSSRQRKISNFNTLPSYDLPSQTLKPRNKDAGNSTINLKAGKFGTTADCIMNDFLLDQDDEMVPWLNYHMDDDSLQQDYCSDYLTGLSGVTENEFSTPQSNFAPTEKRSNFDHNHSNSVNNRLGVEQGLIPKAFDSEFCKSKTSQLCPLSSPHQTSFPSGSSISNVTSNATHNTVCENLSMRAQNQDSRLPKINSGFMNFSHFSRPASMVKANLLNINAFASSSLPSEDKVGCMDKESLPELSLIESSDNLRNGMSSQIQPMMASNNVNTKFLKDKNIDELHNVEQSSAKCHVDASRAIGSNSYKDIADVGEKTIEGAVTSSSACSLSSVDKTSNDQPHDLKRKCRDTEESDYPSDDVEEESIGAKKTASTRGGSGSKRGRAAEVHNLSERKRRDRINEKMRALQELIPNCNKVDKASMLDEAIEYLKTLQIQVQIMSMGAGLYMRPMMLPTGMQHMHAAHMSHFSPMGMGMGFGMGMVDANGGSPGYPVMPVPLMQGGHFRGPQILGPPSINGMAGSNHQMFRLAAQGHPMPVTQMNSLSSGTSPSIPGPGGPIRSQHSAQAFSSKDPSMNNMQVMQHADANRLMNQISSQETNQGFEHSASMLQKDKAADVSGSGTRDSQS